MCKSPSMPSKGILISTLSLPIYASVTVTQVYFSLRRLEFEKQCEQDTKGEKFHVLTLVDGDHVRIRSVEHPERYFDLDFMEIACVPADMGKYVIENLGKEPIRVHKTCLRDGYEFDPA